MINPKVRNTVPDRQVLPAIVLPNPYKDITGNQQGHIGDNYELRITLREEWTVRVIVASSQSILSCKSAVFVSLWIFFIAHLGLLFKPVVTNPNHDGHIDLPVK